MRFGVLVSGGDCPGLNATIRAFVLHAVDVLGHEVIGFRDGWRGVIEDDWITLDRPTVRGISPLGGSIIGTSRVSPFSEEAGGPEGIKKRLDSLLVDGLIMIGGNGTQTVSHMMQEAGINVIGLPKTIDNDLAGTDLTFGFDTAVSIATEAIDRLRTTGDAHRRCMVLEVMGREAGWIALNSGIAGGAHTILIPEHPESIEQVCAWVESVRDRVRSPMVVVAEGFTLDGMDEAVSKGATDPLGRPLLGGIGEVLARLIEERTGMETRATVLGHIQRGGLPTSFDRVLATRVGLSAASAADQGNWGNLVALKGDRIDLVPLAEVANRVKPVPDIRYEEIRRLFG